MGAVKIYFIVLLVLLAVSSARPQAVTPVVTTPDAQQNPLSLFTLPLQLPMNILNSLMKG